jgi:hypothetical protein
VLRLSLRSCYAAGCCRLQAAFAGCWLLLLLLLLLLVS